VTEDRLAPPWLRMVEHPDEGVRLRAIGRMAAGVADDIGQPLQVVEDKARFLREAFASLLAVMAQYREMCVDVEACLGSDITHWARQAERGANIRSLQADIPVLLDEALQDLQRASEVVHAVRSLSDPVTERRVRVDLNRVVTEAVLLAHGRVGRVARLETAYGPPLPVDCHPSLVTLAVVHLLLDAADEAEGAAPHDPRPRRIQIATTRDGDAAVVSLVRTSPDPRQRAGFEQPNPERAGWDVARAIVEQRHQGRLVFESEGRETAVKIRLPLGGTGPV
jgi:signal transduction histidine kinase